MDLVTFPQKEKSLRLSYSEIKFYLVFSLVLSGLIYWLHSYLFEKNYAEELFLFLGEKSQMAHGGASPDIDNWLFVTPLIPYTLVLYLCSPYIALSLLSGFLWAGWLYSVRVLFKRRQITFGLALVLWAFLALSPTSVWFFIEMPQLAFVYSAFVISLYALRRYFFKNISSEFLVFALASALVVQNNIPSFAVYLAYILPAASVIWTLKKPPVPLILVIIFPTLFFIFAPMAMNGLLHSDFSLSGIIHYFPMLNVDLEAYEGSWIETGKFMLRLFWENGLYTLPFWIFWFRVPFHQHKGVYISFLGAPLIFLGVKIYFGGYIPDLGTLILFPLFAILLLSAPFRVTLKKKAGFELILSVLFMGAILWDFQTLTNGAHKPDFYRALLGAPFAKHNISDEIALAKILRASEGRVLTDERVTYKIIYLVDDPMRFVVPYQYRFETVLSKPERFVKWVLVTEGFRQDRVLKTYPAAKFGELPGYRVAHQIGDFTLFERVEDPDLSTQMPQQE
ncbi:MAG: hypothetical protein KDK62_02115 [Chlamydiia bacterium]|nr:hypothetical protein [Chlamydiia bacterium]